MTFYAQIQIYNLSGLFSPTELLNECPSHIQICPTAIMKTQGFPSGMTVCKIHCFLFPTALTMATVLQSDCNSCFLCIYANVCLDIADSGLIVFLPAFKNQIKVSSKWIVINYSTMEFFCNSPRAGGLHANNLISIAKSPYYNVAIYSEEAKHIRQ